nr:unnamed protein product [Spirometra erinaceieuropaei]
MRQLHDAILARVADSGSVSVAFTVICGVQQGWVLAPTHYTLMFSALLMEAYRDERPAASIVQTTGDEILDVLLMQAPKLLSKTTVPDLLYADDCSSNSATELGTQRAKLPPSNPEHGQNDEHTPAVT